MDKYRQNVAETVKFSEVLETRILAGFKVEKHGTISQVGNFFPTKELGSENILFPIKAHEICLNVGNKEKTTMIVHSSEKHTHILLVECSLEEAQRKNKLLEALCLVAFNRETGTCLVGCQHLKNLEFSKFSLKTFELFQKIQTVFFEESKKIMQNSVVNHKEVFA